MEQLKYDRQPVGIKSNLNRYRTERLITDLNSKEKFLESYQRKEIPVSPEDLYHQVRPEEEDRLDLISYRYYQTPLLWWIIAEANGLTNLLVGPEVGDMLRVPSITTLYGNGGMLL
jgi:hypothetical protein